MIYQPGDQADCCRIGFHICNINALDGNEREWESESENKKEKICVFSFCSQISEER